MVEEPPKYIYSFYCLLNSLFSTQYFSSINMRRLLPTFSQPGFFNLTSHFRSDSDLPFQYFSTERRSIPCAHCLPNSSLLLNKTKLMLWIVSHCKTQSKGEEYMAELSKYIKVDVFGKCGNFTPKCGSHKDYSCTNSMMEGYKFYFAAENSICKEYFTGNNNYLQCLYNLYPLKTDFGIFFI